MDKVACIIQARSGSTRLPNKCFLPFGEISIVERIYDESFCSKYVKGNVFVAVPLDDHTLIRYLAVRKKKLFTGSGDDVLDRFYQCAKLLNVHHIVRITADCPLLTSEIIDNVIGVHLLSGADYTANRLFEPAYPDGFDVEIFKFEWLLRAWEMTTLLEDREHVTPWIKRSGCKTMHVHCPPELIPFSNVKLSVDTQEDYERVLKWREEHNWK